MQCGAAFVRDGVPVAMQPLVEELSPPGRYSVLLRIGLDLGRLIFVAVLAAMNFFLVGQLFTETKTTEIVASVLLLLLMFPVMLYVLFLAVRATFGRVLVDVGHDAIVITETIQLFRTPRQIPRESLDGFWVAGSVDDGGQPIASYSLMADSAGRRSVPIVPGLLLLEPALALAEGLAKHLGVPADTRGSDFR
jgi:hypothetical protein